MKLNHIYITRFIAALAVVIYHYGQEIYPFNKGIVFDIVHYGDEFVNYFFILSGFIMVVAYYKPANTGLLLNKKKYYINRFARIYPVYLLALLFVVLYVFTINKSLFTHFGIRLTLELLLLQSWTGKSSLNFPGWTLSVELFFYICFPFLLQYLSDKTAKFLLLAGALIYIINLSVDVYLTDHFTFETTVGKIKQYFPLFHLATFTTGVIAGLIFIKKYTFLKSRQRLIKIAGYSLAALFLLVSIYMFNFPKYHHNGFLIPAYFFFVSAFSLESKWTSPLSNSVFVYLGEISYSLYILQVPVWLFYQYFSADMGFSRNISFYIYLLVLIATSSLIYSLFERNAQNWIKLHSKPLLA